MAMSYGYWLLLTLQIVAVHNSPFSNFTVRLLSSVIEKVWKQEKGKLVGRKLHTLTPLLYWY